MKKKTCFTHRHTHTDVYMPCVLSTQVVCASPDQGYEIGSHQWFGREKRKEGGGANISPTQNTRKNERDRDLDLVVQPQLRRPHGGNTANVTRRT